MCSGSTNGDVSIWDLCSLDCESEKAEQEVSPVLKFTASDDDCINSAWYVPPFPVQ